MAQELVDNSLKQGESKNYLDLLKIGDREGALAIFHEVIMSKRKGNLDRIMVKFI
jgi:hypothetical protein